MGEVRLIERVDLNYIRIDGLAYWSTLGDDGLELPGPFLFCVNDTGAWLRVTHENGRVGTSQIHYDNADLFRGSHWSRAVEVWLRDEPITRLDMIQRYRHVGQTLENVERRWSVWEEVYQWEDGSDLMWDGLSVHRQLEARDIDGVRSVLWRGNGSWLRHWDRERTKHGK